MELEIKGSTCKLVNLYSTLYKNFFFFFLTHVLLIVPKDNLTFPHSDARVIVSCSPLPNTHDDSSLFKSIRLRKELD